MVAWVCSACRFAKVIGVTGLLLEVVYAHDMLGLRVSAGFYAFSSGKGTHQQCLSKLQGQPLGAARVAAISLLGVFCLYTTQEGIKNIAFLILFI